MAPGIWKDQDGALHVSIPEILDHFGWPHDEENIEGVKRSIENVLRTRGFNQSMIFQEKCPHCGAPAPARPIARVARSMTEFAKAISLYQPHATLVALGEKRFETRSWGTHHRGLLLIHAAHKRPPEYLKLAQTEPFRRALAKDPLWMVRRMQVIAAVNMANCIRIFSAPPREVLQFGNYELAFGDFSPGRWAWHFPDAVRFPEPFYARGGRKFFNVPAHQVLLATESWERCPAWWEKVEGWPGCRCKFCREKGEARAYC